MQPEDDLVLALTEGKRCGGDAGADPKCMGHRTELLGAERYLAVANPVE